MGEDAKIQTVSNDLRRRLLNNSEAMGAGSKKRVVDQYAQKLRNSGYEIEQVRRIIFNGIKGYENKRRRSNEMGWKLHRTSLDSMGARVRKKLLAKSSWFKKKRNKLRLSWAKPKIRSARVVGEVSVNVKVCVHY